jgi:hypothetical protein
MPRPARLKALHGPGGMTTADRSVESQLRVYRIAPGHIDDFVAAWTAGVLPLRRRFGFEIDAWTQVDGDRFVWLIRWRGSGSLADADAAYYASPQRMALDPDPAQWIVGNETFDLNKVAGG